MWRVLQPPPLPKTMAFAVHFLLVSSYTLLPPLCLFHPQPLSHPWPSTPIYLLNNNHLLVSYDVDIRCGQAGSGKRHKWIKQNTRQNGRYSAITVQYEKRNKPSYSRREMNINREVIPNTQHSLQNVQAYTLNQIHKCLLAI